MSTTKYWPFAAKTEDKHLMITLSGVVQDFYRYYHYWYIWKALYVYPGYPGVFDPRLVYHIMAVNNAICLLHFKPYFIEYCISGSSWI